MSSVEVSDHSQLIVGESNFREGAKGEKKKNKTICQIK